jgi:polysaccharide biosynthesis/export protein
VRVNKGVLFFVLMSSLLYNVSALPQQKTPEQSSPISPSNAAKYVLGPGDQIEVKAVEAPEAGGTFIIPAGGVINTTLGEIQAAGLTSAELQQSFVNLLKRTVIRPQITVNITAFKSQPVTINGSVAQQGVQQLEGRKNLIEVISSAGGRNAEAGSIVRITRKIENGPIPLDSATMIADGMFSIAEINLREIENGTHPEKNIQILPNDNIFVERAHSVYLVGEVKKPGTYILTDSDTITIARLLAKADGFLPTADKKKGKILRGGTGAAQTEIAINLQAIWSGKKEDITLQPEDILFVPNSYAKDTVRKTFESIVGMVPGLAIYRL